MPVAVLACGGVILSACGGAKAYVPLTAANLSSTIAAATKNLHTGHEVATGNGITTTIDFNNSAVFAYRLTQSSASSANGRSLIGIGSDRYLQYPGVTPAGKWLKVSGSTNTPVITFKDVNPVTMVVRFNKGLKTFTYVGPTKIAGVQVQHYKLTIDQQKYLKATGQGLGSANLGSAETLTEDLYLNEDNTLRRVTLTLPGGVGNTQVDATNWGKPVTITAPQASTVVTSVQPPTKK